MPPGGWGTGLTTGPSAATDEAIESVALDTATKSERSRLTALGPFPSGAADCEPSPRIPRGTSSRARAPDHVGLLVREGNSEPISNRRSRRAHRRGDR